MNRFSLLLMLVAWLGCGLEASAQWRRSSVKPQRHEVGLDLGGLTYVPDYGPHYQSGLGLHPLHGLRYKFHLSMNDALRLGVLRQNASFAERAAVDGPSSEGERRHVRIQVGYERSLVAGPSRFFFGVDGVANLGTLDFRIEEPGTDPLSASEDYQGFGAHAFLGYRYYFTPYVSATLEMGGYHLTHTYDANFAAPRGAAPYLSADSELGAMASFYLSFHLGDLDRRCKCPKF